jgi:hypothetical protein
VLVEHTLPSSSALCRSWSAPSCVAWRSRFSISSLSRSTRWRSTSRPSGRGQNILIGRDARSICRKCLKMNSNEDEGVPRTLFDVSFAQVKFSATVQGTHGGCYFFAFVSHLLRLCKARFIKLMHFVMFQRPLLGFRILHHQTGKFSF